MDTKLQTLTVRGGPHPHGIEVRLDGQQVPNCTALSVSASADAPWATATLTLLVLPDLSVVAEVEQFSTAGGVNIVDGGDGRCIR